MTDRIERLYPDVWKGEAPVAEWHCEVCKATKKYCPGHGHEARYASLAMMAPAPGIVVPMRATMKAATAPNPGPYGYFLGDPVARWNADGERMQILEDFTYRDGRWRDWTTPKGTIVDGASIPRFVWSLVGAPFNGKYRYASVVHDHYCDVHEAPWEHVHRMFYEACMAGGCSSYHAKILFYAVWHFGPRWRIESAKNHPPATLKQPMRDDDGRLAARIEEYITDRDPSLEDIEGTKPVELGLAIVTSKRSKGEK
jgi:hypothetical protein